MIGHKRYGSREGGVEVVVTELARRMVELGHEVTCYDRSGSDVMTGCAADCRGRVIDGVHVVPVKTIDKKGLAALSSSYFATRAAIKDRPDVIHYHAEGPCVPLPLAKLAGIRTVATIHGLDWQRAKWGRLASTYIKMGERAAATKADGLVVLSKSAQSYFQDVYGRTTTFIPNGIEPKQYRPVKQIKDKWGLDAGSYVPVAAALCRELLLDGSRAHAGGLCRARMGRRADNGPGPENRPELRGLHGPHLRSGEYQGAGVQPGALGAQLSRKHSDERLEAARTAQRRYLAPGTSRRSSRPCRRPCRR